MTVALLCGEHYGLRTTIRENPLNKKKSLVIVVRCRPSYVLCQASIFGLQVIFLQFNKYQRRSQFFLVSLKDYLALSCIKVFLSEKIPL